jgi:hypothetical protein
MFANVRRAQIIDYSILHHTSPRGPVIGLLDGCEFSAFVQDEFGRLFAYCGVAPRLSNGAFDDAALKEGEFIVLPGLIYSYCGNSKRA